MSRVGLVWLVGVGLATLPAGCRGRAPSTTAPAHAPADDRAATPAAVPEPVGTPDEPGAARPPWLGGLLDPSAVRSYDWSFSVDTHGEDGELLEVEGRLECRSSPPQRHALPEGVVAWVSCQECTASIARSEVDVEPALDACLVVTEGGLWIEDGPPPLDQPLAELLASPPYLPTTPAPRKETRTVEDDGFVIELGLSIAPHADGGWCRADWSSELYGSLLERCFEPGRGLTEVEHQGREGPSQEHYRLRP